MAMSTNESPPPGFGPQLIDRKFSNKRLATARLKANSLNLPKATSTASTVQKLIKVTLKTLE